MTEIPKSMTERVLAAVIDWPSAPESMATANWRSWCRALEAFGEDSGPERGALLAVVRDAWGCQSLVAARLAGGWVTCDVLRAGPNTPKLAPIDYRRSATEREALVLGFEEARRWSDGLAR